MAKEQLILHLSANSLEASRQLIESSHQLLERSQRLIVKAENALVFSGVIAQEAELIAGAPQASQAC